MKKLLLAGLGALVLALVVLVVMPSRIDPAEWQPPVPPKAEGVLAPNDKLKAAEPLAPELPGPEELSFDPAGNLVAGLADGRVVRMSADGKGVTELANTGGRPLGLKYAPDGRLIVCDTEKGLLALGADGKLDTLVPASPGPHVFDDLAVSGAAVFFSDASTRFPFSRYTDDVFEHRGSGRVLRYDFATKETTLLANGCPSRTGSRSGRTTSGSR